MSKDRLQTFLERTYRNGIRRRKINIVYNSILGLTMMALILWLWQIPIVLFCSLMVVSGVVWYVNCCRHAIFYQIGGGIVFSIIGVICVLTGIWSYNYSSVLDILLWLFPVWGNITLIIRKGNFDILQDLVVKLNLTKDD